MSSCMYILLLVVLSTAITGPTKGIHFEEVKTISSDDSTVLRVQPLRKPIIYRGLGSCLVNIPDVNREKLIINIAFSKAISRFTVSFRFISSSTKKKHFSKCCNDFLIEYISCFIYINHLPSPHFLCKTTA